MKFKSINDYTTNKQGDLQELIRCIKNGNHAFILIHRNGCPPCEATRPEWLKIQNKLSKKYKPNNDVIVADVEEKYINGLEPDELTIPRDTEDIVLKPYIGDIDGFPTMRLIKENGNKKESYEDSNISKTDRSLDSFTEWIEQSINKNPTTKVSSSVATASSPYKLLNRLTESTTSNKAKKLTKKRIAKHKIKGGKRRTWKIKNKKNKKHKKRKTKKY